MRYIFCIIAMMLAGARGASAQSTPTPPVELACPAGYSPMMPNGTTVDTLTGGVLNWLCVNETTGAVAISVYTLSITGGGGGISTAFSAITSGVNTIATMIVGSGATMSYTGTGVIASSNSDCLGNGYLTTNNIACGLGSGPSAASSFTTSFGFGALAGSTGNSDYAVAIGDNAAGSLGNNSVEGSFMGGYQAGDAITCQWCVGIGYQVFKGTGPYSSNNIAIGSSALNSPTSQTFVNDTAVGANAMQDATGELIGNTAIGASAMLSTSNGSNTAIGYNTANAGVSGPNNVFIGAAAANGSNVSGANNIVIGTGTGHDLSSGSDNICIGNACNNVSPGGDNFLVGVASAVDVPSSNLSFYMNMLNVLTGVYKGLTPLISFNIPVSYGVTVNSGIQTGNDAITICNGTTNAAFCGQAQPLTDTVSIIDEGGCTGGNVDHIAGTITYYDAAGSHTLSSNAFTDFPIGDTNTGYWQASFLVGEFSSTWENVTLNITKTDGTCGGASEYEIVSNLLNTSGVGQNTFSGPGGSISAASIGAGTFSSGTFNFPGPLQVGGNNVATLGIPGVSTGTVAITSATSGTTTFGASYPSIPICVASLAGTTPPVSPLSFAVSSTQTSVTITLGVTGTATFNFVCSVDID